MKYITTFFFLIASFYSLAQSATPVLGKVQHNDAERTCLVLNIEPTPDQVEEAWEDFLKDNYKIKLDGTGLFGSGSLLVAEEVTFGAISSKKMDFYTNIEEKNGITEMKVFAAFGYDMYIDPTNTTQEYEALKDIVEKFVATYLPTYYQNSIEETEKRLKKMNKAQRKLDKKLKKDKEKIADLEEDIESREEEREKNVETLEMLNKTLKMQKENLEKILKEINRK